MKIGFTCGYVAVLAAPVLALPLLHWGAPPWAIWAGTSVLVGLPALVMLYLQHHVVRECERKATALSDARLTFANEVIKVIPQPVYVKDGDSRYVIVNQAFADARALPISQIVGYTTADIARDAEDAKVSREEDLRVLAGQKITKVQYDLHPDDGSVRHRLVTKGPGYDLDGRPIIVGVNFDLSEWWSPKKKPAG